MVRCQLIDNGRTWGLITTFTVVGNRILLYMYRLCRMDVEHLNEMYRLILDEVVYPTTGYFMQLLIKQSFVR